jgi:iron complex transport system ATP-binding protein
MLADTLARTVLAPQQLPVGVLTALIGVPVFLFQLHQLHLRRPMIETTDLTLRMNARLLVKRLDWQVAAGENWCVIGPNGAGKSTLLRTLAGLRAPDGGSILLAGKPLALAAAGTGARARLPGAVAQRRLCLPRHRNRADGAPPLSRRPLLGRQRRPPAAEQALRTLDVLHLAQRDVRTLSGGERQRVAIAALLAQDTPLLLLDEPANALDLAHQVAMTDLLARLCREQGRAVVSVGHDLNLAWSGATHALLLHGDGQWRAGPVAEVMRADLLGACLGHPIAVIEHGGRTIFLPDAPAPANTIPVRRAQ